MSTLATTDEIRLSEGGVYDLPVVGRHLGRLRRAADDLAPNDEDSLGVRAGKTALRTGVIACATGLAMIVVL